MYFWGCFCFYFLFVCSPWVMQPFMSRNRNRIQMSGVHVQYTVKKLP